MRSQDTALSKMASVPESLITHDDLPTSISPTRLTCNDADIQGESGDRDFPFEYECPEGSEAMTSCGCGRQSGHPGTDLHQVCVILLYVN